MFLIPISFAVSNNGFLKPNPSLHAFSISSISLAPFVINHAALFSMFATQLYWITFLS